MMLAGAKWKSGTDTCVFKPAVKCQGETEVRPGVSRIRKKENAERDILIETRLRDAFPALVESGAVNVFSHQCVPEFTKEDIASDPAAVFSGKGCERLGEISEGPVPALTNLVTPEVMSSMKSALTQLPNLPTGNRIILMRRALQTAVDLVPDEGPWIIHADCHLGNVLLSGGNSTLADWGRAVIVENPKDIASIRKGVKEWLLSLSHIGLVPEYPAYKFLMAMTLTLHQPKEYAQHPRNVLGEIAINLWRKEEENQEIARQALRGWLLYVLINQAFGVDDQTLLKTPSQKELQAKLEAFLASQKGGMYWPAKYSRGLTRKQVLQRKRSATRRKRMSWKDPKAYVPWKTDMGVKTRRSSYTEQFRKRCPTAKTLPEISKCTRVPTRTLRTVYNRGMAAWRTGHRPGASQHAWGMARVHSFVMKGKTYRTADADLARKIPSK